MKIVDLLGEWFGTDAYYRHAAPAWARRHLPDADESIAGTVAEVVATVLGVGLDQLPSVFGRSTFEPTQIADSR